ncbi:MAG: cache domain-containing protein [Desulfobacterales bacterium]|nr:cache domain-containing protein [Desulfobacterales bacterium]
MKSIAHVILTGSILICLLISNLSIQLSYADTGELEKLAAESETYCKTTAKEEPTSPNVIIEKVNEACNIISKEGAEAFPKFKGNNSSFLFEGTYIWIHTLNGGKMLMHPIKYKMEGNVFIDLKDKNGKRFFSIMNNVVKESGAGWVEYEWPVPGSSGFQRKISYIKGCKMPDGTDVVIGCGIYKYKDEDINKLEIK